MLLDLDETTQVDVLAIDFEKGTVDYKRVGEGVYTGACLLQHTVTSLSTSAKTSLTNALKAEVLPSV
jgi:hypothetical protein